jgi:hypothetical protein
VAWAVILAGSNGVWGEALEKVSLLAPIRAGGNDGLNNLVLVPQLDTAVTLGKNHWNIELSTEYVDNEFDEVSGTSGIRITGGTFETHLRVTYGVLSYLDLTADFALTAYDGKIGATVNSQSFFQPFPQGAAIDTVDADREIADPVLEAKFQVWGGQRECTGVALRAAAKFPLADERDIHSTGAFDFSVGTVASLDTQWGIWHANLDYTFVGDQDAFRSEADVDLKNTLSFGAAYWFEVTENKLALGAQISGYLNPYRDVPGDFEGFGGTPVSALFGLRWYPYQFLAIDAGAGPGLTSDAADFTATIGVSLER